MTHPMDSYARHPLSFIFLIKIIAKFFEEKTEKKSKNSCHPHTFVARAEFSQLNHRPESKSKEKTHRVLSRVKQDDTWHLELLNEFLLSKTAVSNFPERRGA